MQEIEITLPDDWHVHFRDNEALHTTVNATAKHFARALVMPNLSPPLTTLDNLIAYRNRIQKANAYSHFNPYMTFFLNDSISPDDLFNAKTIDFILGAKLYPAGATTNSDQGASSIQSLFPLLDVLQDADLVLQIHGEVTYGDIFVRETLFLNEYLAPIIQNFPKLRIVLEHISTSKAVEFIKAAPPNVAATITAHHLLYNRNHLLAGGIKPHFYCLPILKKESDQNALLEAATSGDPKFFAGTDSAPHTIEKKESNCGCAGIYTAPFAVSLYAHAFSVINKMSALDSFMGKHGAEFYHLPLIKDKIRLIRKPLSIPQSLPLGSQKVVPAGAGSTIEWCVHEK